MDVAKLIRDAGRTAVSIPGDLRDEAFCTRLVAQAVELLGGVDILVSNAARQQSRASILDATSEDFGSTMKPGFSSGRNLTEEARQIPANSLIWWTE